MGPEKASRLAASQLMMAYKNTTPYVLGETPVGQGWRAARSGQKFSSNRTADDAVAGAARRLVPFTDYYPINKCQSLLRDFVVGELDASTPLAQVHGNLSSQILNFVQTFKTQGTWEVAHAVRGIDLTSGTFSIGDCSFYSMDEDQFLLWGRRSATGQYDPPENAPIPNDWISQESAMKDQIVVAARVKAIDHDHAEAKGKKRMTEAIDLLRYGQLAVGYPERPIPELGLWLRQWQHDHNFVIQIDAPNFGTKKTLAGPEGCDYSMCKQAPAWSKLEQIVQRELADRNELELRLMTALSWIGQAAAAPADTIRLVALVTSLEALLIQESETLGKRSKLSARISMLVGRSEDERQTFAGYVDELYRTRSGCVHAGLLEIEKEEVGKCTHVVRSTLEAILTRSPYSSMTQLAQIVEHIEPKSSTSEHARRQWVAENAYFRWLDEIKWSDSGRPPNRHLQHWEDAEREFICNHQRSDKSSDDLNTEDSSS